MRYYNPFRNARATNKGDFDAKIGYNPTKGFDVRFKLPNHAELDQKDIYYLVHFEASQVYRKGSPNTRLCSVIIYANMTSFDFCFVIGLISCSCFQRAKHIRSFEEKYAHVFYFRGERLSMSVCLSVCLSARITRKPHGRTLPTSCTLTVAMVRSASDGFAIRYNFRFCR